MGKPRSFTKKVTGLRDMIESSGFVFEQPKEAYSGNKYKNMRPWEQFTECFVQLFKAAIQRKDKWGTYKSEIRFWKTVRRSLRWARQGRVSSEPIMRTVHLLIEGRRRFLRESLDLPRGSLLSAWVQGWIEAIDSPELKEKKTAEALGLEQKDPDATSDAESEDMSNGEPRIDAEKDEES
ncbi:hypothetical protein PG996_001397 [Apiospora saccharicola]|uniref:Uncharacterized protein n=1 Tax=Apiospora saccharicola TaxID=335842 RepID=A0ABR1WGJ1_9PEZI